MLRASAHCDRGGRAFHEQAFIIDCDVGLFAVVDGTGGGAVSHHPAVLECACDTMIAALRDANVADPRTRILDAVQAANAAIWQLVNTEPLAVGNRVQLVALYWPTSSERAWCVWVGLGEAFVLPRHATTLDRCSVPHTLASEMVSAGTITLDEARSSPFRSVVVRVLGAAPAVEPGVCELALRDGDRVLLSHGLRLADEGTNDAARVLASAPVSAAARLIVEQMPTRPVPTCVTAVVVERV